MVLLVVPGTVPTTLARIGEFVLTDEIGIGRVGEAALLVERERAVYRLCHHRGIDGNVDWAV